MRQSRDTTTRNRARLVTNSASEASASTFRCRRSRLASGREVLTLAAQQQWPRPSWARPLRKTLAARSRRPSSTQCGRHRGQNLGKRTLQAVARQTHAAAPARLGRSEMPRPTMTPSTAAPMASRGGAWYRLSARDLRHVSHATRTLTHAVGLPEVEVASSRRNRSGWQYDEKHGR